MPSRRPHSATAWISARSRSSISASRMAAPATTMSARSGLSPGTARRSSRLRAHSILATSRTSARVSVSTRCGVSPRSARTTTLARLRIEPDVPNTTSIRSPTMCLRIRAASTSTRRRMASYVLAATGAPSADSGNSPVRRMAPRRSESRYSAPVPSPSATSVLPPPMSMTSARLSPRRTRLRTPRKMRRASSWPDTTRTSRPASSRSLRTNAALLAASRVAEVATVTTVVAP